MSSRVDEVLPTREARAKLPSMLAGFRDRGAEADPVVIGAHRRPEAVVLSYERYLALLTGRERVQAILDSSHHGARDFSVIVPAELLAEQKRTENLFNAVMVAIASISLVVGGIGIMNIMLASVSERTREIGLRRAVGARQSDIVRQFVVEATTISFAGGSVGVVFGFLMSRLIAWLAGWSTIVTASSIALAFLVSISVGLVFGIYPAMKAARLDPVDAIRHE
jgi:putative ABC transport system permease protein